MKLLRLAAAVLPLLGTLGPAATLSFAQSQPAPGETGISEGAGLRLSAEQRAAIVKAIDQEKAKLGPQPNFHAAIGAEAPASIALYMLPDDAVAAIPAEQKYEYTMVQDQVVLVDPTTMRVVDIIR